MWGPSKRSRLAAFETELRNRTRLALVDLRHRIGNERLYFFALYTSHEDEYLYVVASANTEEAYERRVEEYLRRDPTLDVPTLRRSLRVSGADAGYHDFFPPLAAIEIPSADDVGGARLIYGAFASALRALDEERLFGTGAEREKIILNVICGDMSDDFFEAGLRALNPRAVIHDYFAKWTPRGFVDRVNALSAVERRWKWLALYEALALHAPSATDPMLAEARTAGLTEYDAGEQVRRLGAVVVPDLVKLIGRHARARTFNERDTVEYARDGAFTRESSMASSTAFVIEEIGEASEEDIAALQAIVVEIVERDRELPRASPLGENVARVLHGLRPRRFPKTVIDPHTNHLRNPEAFVAKK